MRVLVVEDEKKTASFIRKALQAEGFAAEACHTSEPGIKTTATVRLTLAKIKEASA
jgi:DNA-binding response OmpR family regulator